MPRTRLELAHPCEHQPLKLACLPISPSGLFSGAKIINFPNGKTSRPEISGLSLPERNDGHPLLLVQDKFLPLFRNFNICKAGFFKFSLVKLQGFPVSVYQEYLFQTVFVLATDIVDHFIEVAMA